MFLNKKLLTRIIAIILGIIAVFTGGNVNNVHLEIKDEITTETEVIEVDIFNGSGRRIATGEEFDIEKKVDGKWERLHFVDNYSYPEIAYIIVNLHTMSFYFDVIKAFGKHLDEGQYRFVKPDLEKYPNNSVEFTVKAA